VTWNMQCARLCKASPVRSNRPREMETLSSYKGLPFNSGLQELRVYSNFGTFGFDVFHRFVRQKGIVWVFGEEQ
jgi:hypothetical protein